MSRVFFRDHVRGVYLRRGFARDPRRHSSVRIQFPFRARARLVRIHRPLPRAFASPRPHERDERAIKIILARFPASNDARASSRTSRARRSKKCPPARVSSLPRRPAVASSRRRRVVSHRSIASHAQIRIVRRAVYPRGGDLARAARRSHLLGARCDASRRLGARLLSPRARTVARRRPRRRSSSTIEERAIAKTHETAARPLARRRRRRRRRARRARRRARGARRRRRVRRTVEAATRARSDASSVRRRERYARNRAIGASRRAIAGARRAHLRDGVDRLELGSMVSLRARFRVARSRGGRYLRRHGRARRVNASFALVRGANRARDRDGTARMPARCARSHRTNRNRIPRPSLASPLARARDAP